ncbi:MAG: bifunctional folylpolyglutamate synthase/dihydrofolate synthase [Limosilactobacillus sp.]|nr:bifunctional folylpolyglutamate synthase/dihydrofolate synthase [Limosilactobacillus sp.]
MIQTYAEALAWIHSRPRLHKEPSLGRLQTLLTQLGNPQVKQHYLHVTGTNGKGSTVAMIGAMLAASGLRVGTFTSPYITRFNERIMINQVPISDADLLATVQVLAPIVTQLDTIGQPVTEFEVVTALMFTYFATQPLDVVILEVGIGGLYDSTNVIDHSDVAVITTVGYDHQKLLGDDLAAIATQKAGIIKGGIVVTGWLPERALSPIQQQVKRTKATWYRAGEAFSYRSLVAPKFHYQGLQTELGPLTLGLQGQYQLANAAVATTAVLAWLKLCQLPVDLAALRRGLSQVSWPGRWEIMQNEPLVILDGAHNLPGMQALCASIRQQLGGREVYVLLGVLADKQAELMLGELAALPQVHLVLTTFTGPNQHRHSQTWQDLPTNLVTTNPIVVTENWQLGLGQIIPQLTTDDVLLITGSLYFISEVRNFLLND